MLDYASSGQNSALGTTGGGRETIDMDKDHMLRVSDDEAASVASQAEPCGRLEIFRAKRGPDLFRAYHVLVDGADIGEVRRGQSRLFDISTGRHEVHLVIDWARSPSIDIDLVSGETAKLVCWPKFHFGQAKKAMANSDEWISVRCELSCHRVMALAAGFAVRRWPS